MGHRQERATRFRTILILGNILAVVLPLVSTAAAKHAKAVDATTAAAEAQLKKTCNRCHGLNVVRAQRLSRDEWDRELDKMTKMGAKIADRSALLDYLSKKYADADAK